MARIARFYKHESVVNARHVEKAQAGVENIRQVIKRKATYSDIDLLSSYKTN